MAFFSKLKDRLFKSSSKLEEGLDAIVEDGGEEEASSHGISHPRTARAWLEQGRQRRYPLWRISRIPSWNVPGSLSFASSWA